MKKIIVRGPALSRSGYGEQCRFALRALKSRSDIFDLYLLPTGWGATSWLHEDTEERRWIDELIIKTNTFIQESGENPEMDVSLQITIPNEWEPMAPINIGYTAGIEVTHVDPKWIEKASLVDHIITPSTHSRDVYKNTSYKMKDPEGNVLEKDYKCQTPITVVPFPVRDYPSTPVNLDLEYDFNFVTVAQWGWRKNIENTVRWFVEEFIDQEVGLVLKLSVMNDSTPDHFETAKRLKSLLKPYKNRKCKIYLLHGSMSDAEINSLYNQPKIKAYVTATRGEGFGLPIFEAAYNGLPVIAPEWSGHMDYLRIPGKEKKGKQSKPKNKFAKVDFDINVVPTEAVWEDVIPANAGCCYAKQGSFKMKLREVYKDWGRFRKQALELQGWVREHFSETRKYKEMTDTIISTCGTDSEQGGAGEIIL